MLQHDWIEKVPVPEEKFLFDEQNVWYLPHSAVVREGHESTSTRVVFDASAVNRHGESLNGAIFPGPKLQQDLLEILIQVRQHRYLLKADLSKMFHQIMLNPVHRDYHHFVWRNGNPDNPLTVYRWKRLVFGVSQSPDPQSRFLPS